MNLVCASHQLESGAVVAASLSPSVRSMRLLTVVLNRRQSSNRRAVTPVGLIWTASSPHSLEDLSYEPGIFTTQ